MDFTLIKTPVAAQFERMQRHPMFRVDIDKDTLWATYLAAFLPGTNPMFRERTEHDCSCCKQFIRTVGDVVAIINGEIVTIWDVTVSEPGYQTVANTLALLVKGCAIKEPFLHYERSAGTDKSFEEVVGAAPRRWDHFFVNIANNYVLSKDRIPTKLGEERTRVETFKRALTTITLDALDTVLDLIAQNSLYRGQEHKFAVETFKTELVAYELDESAGDNYVWVNAAKLPGAVTGIRNTSIGTLLVDLSEGMEVDAAVRKFEAMVAPANYKRPTAIVTPKMIENAKAKIAELGLMSALERRFAALPDLTINNVLFADRSARKVMGDVFDDLAAQTSARAKVSEKVEEVPVERFLSEIVPKADSIEVLFENKHAGNMVSLIAPVDPTAGRLFKWANNFSWSYSGEMADSIKERVKAAGGNVTGDLCCRLAWHNRDDLDFHLVGPDSKHIYFRDRRAIFGGMLDVDANGMNGMMDNPVENIFFTSRSDLREGKYHLFVNQWDRRETTNIGFEAEIDFMGQVTSFAYDKPMRSGENVTVAVFKYSHAKGIEIIESLPSSQATRNVWGLPTQTFHKVNVLCLSPNYWDEQGVGNKHYFFMLDGAKNDGTARGFFNEFLDSRLDPHRKVFEMVGSKMKPADTPNQLSGLGFSSTQRNTLTVRVKGSFTRTIKVVF